MSVAKWQIGFIVLIVIMAVTGVLSDYGRPLVGWGDALSIIFPPIAIFFAWKAKLVGES